MLKASLLLSTAFCIFATSAFPVYSQSMGRACAKRNTVVKRLADKYGETLKSLGLHRDNAVLEVYASEDTGTWTILLTNTAGQACLVASGQMWEEQADTEIAAGGDDI